MENINFNFPGRPYDVQLEFMHKAYSVMAEGGLCVLESPTGTGKSLSLLCSSLAWLRDFRQKVVFERIFTTAGADQDLPSWMRDSSRQASQDRAACVELEWTSNKSSVRSEVGLYGVHEAHGRAQPKYAKRKLLPASADENLPLRNDACSVDLNQEKVNMLDPNRRVQVIICSRTHSQLSQLIREIKRVRLSDDFNIVTIGSRSQLCIHPAVDTRQGTVIVNDSCRKLVESDACEYKKAIEPLSKLILSNPIDIEDLCEAGKRTPYVACPYFASRLALKNADVVFVPYASVLNPKTRDSLGLVIQDNILIVDEAHNILEAVNSVRSCTLPIPAVESLRKCLAAYIEAYSSKLSPNNLVTIKSVDFLARRLIAYGSVAEALVSGVPDFITNSRLSDIDLVKVTCFLDDFQFARKLKGFCERTESSNPNAIYDVSAFLAAVQSSCPSDRILITVDAVVGRVIRFASINCEEELAKLVAISRAALLVGGTMEPLSEYKSVADLAKAQFSTFRGSSVVHRDRVFCRIVSKSSDSTLVSFDRSSRESIVCKSLIQGVFTTVSSSVTSGGIIVFVSSYDYAGLMERWLRPFCLETGSQIFCDSHTGKDRVFDAYTKQIRNFGKAVLIAVVNGSLSEGIDFKDDLCRCVVVIGLPYANPADLIIQERMQFLDAQHRMNSSYITGPQYYQSRCMKAVNQCIGRAIRHSKDWASIILVDERYRRPETLNGLSDWIRKEVRESSNPQVLKRELTDFHSRFVSN